MTSHAKTFLTTSVQTTERTASKRIRKCKFFSNGRVKRLNRCKFFLNGKIERVNRCKFFTIAWDRTARQQKQKQMINTIFRDTGIRDTHRFAKVIRVQAPICHVRQKNISAVRTKRFSDVTKTGNGERESGNECTAVTRLRIQNGGGN